MARTRKPAAQTKAGNYLLRSRHTDSLIKILALAHVNRIVTSAGSGACMITRDSTWAGNCGWEIKQLVNRGLVEVTSEYHGRHGHRWFKLTEAGHAALDGACIALGRMVDCVKLVAEIDAREVH